jgi:hypothetical protein
MIISLVRTVVLVALNESSAALAWLLERAGGTALALVLQKP